MSDFKKIENKWQKVWDKHWQELYGTGDISTRPGLGKKYILVEFPYPSGSGLHIGHTFSFTGGDIYARFKRMNGERVLFPMGWDAFGLPTENYAIKMKKKPQDVTRDNTQMYKEQMKKLAFSFDWEREVNTTDPDYYKWTQWIFIKLFEKGLAYKKQMPINWCPSCKIGLANEEVIDGKCERCGAEVSRRNISQWVVKITDYADRLIDGLEKTDFIEKVKQAQINWIGKSEGAHIKFSIFNFSRCASQFSNIKELEVFTTRPDTLYGATFMVVAPEHDLVNQIINNQLSISNLQEIKEYVKNARKKSDMERTDLAKEKTGVFSGIYAINPVNGKKIPIWISDFVLASYGTGAIMAVPAHDERDFAFAKKFGLPILPVIEPKGKHDFSKQAYTNVGDGVMINSPLWNGLKPDEAINKAIDYIDIEGIGKRASSYHLRDWIFSRQHYWGEPIPMIFCQHCCQKINNQFPISNFQKNSNDQTSNVLKEELEKYAKKIEIDIKVLLNNPGWYPVLEKDLPVVLPEVKAYEPTDTGESPLAKMTDWVKCKCPVCGGEAKRETDTMPNWAGSDWYYLAYCLAGKLQESGKAGKQIGFDVFSSSKDELKKWMPVDIYIGGDEHNTLHLLYSRFIYQFLYDLGVLPKSMAEPYFRRISHGVILGPDGTRMSKTRGNVIMPESVADKYGVDVVRCYLMFMGPFDATMAWNEKTLMGVRRFLNKFEEFIQNQITRTKSQEPNKSQISNSNNQNITDIDSSSEVKVIINRMVDGISRDIENFKYNTALAKMMEGINNLRTVQDQLAEAEIKVLIKLMAPFAPYTTEELWSQIGSNKNFVHQSSWPEVDKSFLEESSVILPIAINGKKRSEVKINRTDLDDQDMIISLANGDNGIKKWIEGKTVEKYIYVRGRMLNVVVK